MKKMTDKQKARLYQQRRNENYQQSQRIQGFPADEVTLTAEEALRRINELRSHYER
ncbi:YhfG family protein [Sodalis sp. dw_96]|uniref:YhfG family protein n=1 Tax=Sodalis sp. dw_96 TaxID=2719794 RepID=UPI001BD2EA3C|nr:YhfG family protein [Sodalis sp. dw_96]